MVIVACLSCDPEHASEHFSCQRVGVRHLASVSSGSLCRMPRVHNTYQRCQDMLGSEPTFLTISCAPSAGPTSILYKCCVLVSEDRGTTTNTATNTYLLCGKCVSPFSISRMRKAMGSYEVYSRPSPNQILARNEAPAMMISHCFRKLAKFNNGVTHHVAWLGIHPTVTLVCPLGRDSAIRGRRHWKSHAPAEPRRRKAAQRPTS